MYKQLNAILSKYFGLGVFLAIILGFNFQYTAFSMSPYGIYLLFLLMFLSGFSINLTDIKKNFTLNIKPILVVNIIVYLISPLVVWFFANLLLNDDQYIYGVVFASLTPVAAVAPFFTNYYKANTEFSFLSLISSMILSPILIPLILIILLGNNLSIPSILLFKDILILVPLPIFLSIVVKKFFPIVFDFIKKSLPVLNFFILSTLIFIQFGSSLKRLPLNHIDFKSLFFILLIAIIQDFYLFLFIKFINKIIKNDEITLAAIISSSMKNIAIASTVLLLYSPKAAIGPAIGFIAHSILFSPFIVSKIIKKSLE